MTTHAQRVRIGELLYLLVENAQLVRYPSRDVRTRRASEIKTEKQLLASLDAGSFEFDCSQTAEIVCVVAGLNWPASMRDGYTGTMLAHLPHYANHANADLGALAVFGPGTGQHVCQARKALGQNPTLYSHGADRSSYYVSLAVERTFHRPPVTFLSIANL